MYYSDRHRQRVRRWRRFDNLKALAVALVCLVAFTALVINLYAEAKLEGESSFKSRCAISQNMFGEYLNCPVGNQ